MARIFKRTYKYNDEVRRVKVWSVKFSDADDTERTLSLFTDKAASEEAGRKIEKLVALKGAGEPPTVEISRWIDAVPPEIRDKLAEWGIISKARAMGGKNAAGLADAWAQFLVDSGKSKQYAYEAPARAKRIIAENGWNTLSEFNSGALDRWIADSRFAGNWRRCWRGRGCRWCRRRRLCGTATRS